MNSTSFNETSDIGTLEIFVEGEKISLKKCAHLIAKYNQLWGEGDDSDADPTVVYKKIDEISLSLFELIHSNPARAKEIRSYIQAHTEEDLCLSLAKEVYLNCINVKATDTAKLKEQVARAFACGLFESAEQFRTVLLSEARIHNGHENVRILPSDWKRINGFIPTPDEKRGPAATHG